MGPEREREKKNVWAQFWGRYPSSKKKIASSSTTTPSYSHVKECAVLSSIQAIFGFGKVSPCVCVFFFSYPELLLCFPGGCKKSIQQANSSNQTDPPRPNQTAGRGKFVAVLTQLSCYYLSL